MNSHNQVSEKEFVRFDCKRSQCFGRHSMMRNSCINVPADRKNFRIDELSKCRCWNEKIGMDWPRPKAFPKNCPSVDVERKIGVEWPRPKAFPKNCPSVDVERKIGVEWPRPKAFPENFFNVQKASKNSTRILLGEVKLGCWNWIGVTVASPLTFSLVKCTDALAS